MGDRFDPKVPPRKKKKVGMRRFYFLHFPAVSNISVLQMRSSEPVGSTASARSDLPDINAFNDNYVILKYCTFLDIMCVSVVRKYYLLQVLQILTVNLTISHLLLNYLEKGI